MEVYCEIGPFKPWQAAVDDLIEWGRAERRSIPQLRAIVYHLSLLMSLELKFAQGNEEIRSGFKSQLCTSVNVQLSLFLGLKALWALGTLPRGKLRS